MNQENQVKIVLDSLISRLEENYIPLDSKVVALFNSFWSRYDLVKQQRRYFSLPDSYFAQIDRNYRFTVEYAMIAIRDTHSRNCEIQAINNSRLTGFDRDCEIQAIKNTEIGYYNV